MPENDRDAAQNPWRDAAQNPWVVLAILWTVYLIHSIDRSVLLVLLEPIRKTFSLSDAQLGLLSGLGYAAPFALAAIPLGALADRVRRRKTMLAWLIALWSLLTAAGGLATGFVMLVLTRACVGAAEAGAPPAMLSLLGDTFNPVIRPAALSVYFTAPFAGIMAGSIFAGDISAAHGWRVAVAAIGIPGLLAAALVAVLLREPARGRFNQPARPHGPAAPVPVALLYALRNGNVLRLLLALTLAGFVTLAIFGWVPVLMERVFGMSQQRTGGLTALVIGLPSVIGSLAAGAFTARFGRGHAPTLLLICGIAMLIAAVLGAAALGAAALLTPAPRLALPLLAAWSFCAAIYTGSGWSVFTGAIPPQMRGTVMALGVVLVNFIGAGLGPQAVGLLSDALRHGHDPASLQHAMCAATLLNLVTGALFLSSRRISEGNVPG